MLCHEREFSLSFWKTERHRPGTLWKFWTESKKQQNGETRKDHAASPRFAVAENSRSDVKRRDRVDVVRSGLVDEIVQPVGKQQVCIGTPVIDLFEQTGACESSSSG